MEPKSSILTCPLNGKLCVDGIRSDFEFFEVVGIKRQKACRWWTGMAGKHPQTHEILNDYDCAVTWIPLITLENSQSVRQVAAQVSESTKAFVDAQAPETQKQIINRASTGLLKIMLADKVDQLLEPPQQPPQGALPSGK